MKKTLHFLGVILLAVVCMAVGFSACQRKNEPEDNGITISFVTGFENDDLPLIIESRVSTLKKPAEMPENPIKVGYKFLGWFYDKACTKAFSTKDTLKKDTTLYAKWEQKHSNAGGDDESKEVNSNGINLRLNEKNQYEVFGYNGSESELHIPEKYMGKNITTIKKDAFLGNNTITQIYLSKVVSDIEGGAFRGCNKLKSIIVEYENDIYTCNNGIIYTNKNTVLVAVGAGRQENFVVPAKVARFEEYAFAFGKYNISFADGSRMTSISKRGFADYQGEVKLSANALSIEQCAFENATCKIVFPQNCKISKLAIGEFDGYKGEKLVLPSSIKSISGSAFAHSTAEIDFTLTGIKTLGESAFASYNGKKLVIPEFVENIESQCFYKCTAEITFDERTNYMTIKSHVFNDFQGIVYLPSTVQTIKENAFYAMRNGKVYFPKGKDAYTIEPSAFNMATGTIEYNVSVK